MRKVPPECLVERRRWPCAAWVVAIVCAVWSGSAEAEAAAPADTQPRDSQTEVRQLIEDLGADDYDTRELASEALIDLGPPVVSEVEEAANSPLLEVRTRAERILAIISRQSFEQDIKAFIADVDGSSGASLPGWERAEPRLGNTQDARRLYAQLYRAEPALFKAYGPDDSTATVAFDTRLDELHEAHLGRNRSRIHYRLQDQLQQAISTNVMALLFVGADARLELEPNTVVKFRSLFMQSWPPQRVEAAAERDYLRDWLAAWVLHRFSLKQREYEGILLGMRYEIPETLQLALSVLDRRENQHSVMYATLCIGKYGEDWHLSRLEELLGEEVVVAEPHHRENNQAVQYEVQLRDLALYVLLSRTGQDPATYGFRELNPNTDYMYLSQSIAFDGPATREAALGKWQAWRQRNRIMDGEPPSPSLTTLTADASAPDGVPPAPE